MIRILVVEDNPGDIHLLKMALQIAKLECELTVVDDGREALDFARRQGKYASTPIPDLVVLDLNVPKNDGLEVLEALRANDAFSEVPIAVLSSSSSPRDIAKAKRIGVERFIAKPPDLEEYMKIGAELRHLVMVEQPLRTSSGG